MTDPAPSVAARLRDIALDLRRLTYCFRNPEPFYELKSELIGRLEKVCRELERPPTTVGPCPEPAKKKPLKEPVLTGSVVKSGRLIAVVKRARRALQTRSDNRPSRT